MFQATIFLSQVYAILVQRERERETKNESKKQRKRERDPC